MNQRSKPNWAPQWDPRARKPALAFGSDDRPPAIVELQGGYEPPPIPPDMHAPPPLRRIYVEEPTEGWWTRAGEFGFRYTGLVPPEPDTVIPLTEQLHLPGPPRVWWIHWFRFVRFLADEGTDYGTWDLRGRVTYGVGGASNVIECDVAAGVQMALVANSVKVELVTFSPQFGAPYDPGGLTLVAGAMFGDGGAGGALPPTFTTQIYSAPAAPGVLIVDIPVPNFARSVALHTSVSVPADLAASSLFFNTPGITAKTLNLQTAYELLTTEKGVALPPYTNQIRLQVPGAAGTQGQYFALQFFLAL